MRQTVIVHMQEIPGQTKNAEPDMMDMMSGMGWSMAIVGVLVLVFLVLAIAALIKYLIR